MPHSVVSEPPLLPVAGQRSRWLLSGHGNGVNGTHGEAVYIGPEAAGGNCFCEDAVEEQPGCIGCFWPRAQVTTQNWVFVGAGRGKYEPMQQFSYVGEGHGAWEAAEKMVPTGWRVRKCWVAILALPILAGLLILVCGVMSDSVNIPVAMSPQAMITSDSGKSLIAVTKSEPFDCNSSFQWTHQQKAWCCRNRRLGCNIQLPRRTTRPPPVTTLGGAYDCDAGYFGWQKVWSSAKQAWCCAHRSRACHAEPRPPPLPTTPAPAATTPAAASAPPFDCSADYVPCSHCLEERWSVRKRTWCCQHARRGCPTTPLLSYDCNEGYTDCYHCLQRRWSAAKRTWCCVHGGRGCSTTRAPEHPDCGMRVGNWVMPWSDSTKAWCCRHHGVGCASTTPAITLPPFNCSAGLLHWEHGWSVAKKGWCCTHEERGCSTPQPTTSLPYDCDVDFTTCYHCLVSRWSLSKRAWCCQHRGRGCAKTPQPASG